MDPELHQEDTGASNNQILVNLKRLLQATNQHLHDQKHNDDRRKYPGNNP
jgi:hypothetical protein